MPNINQFKTREEYNEWYSNYRKKNREKIRSYNRKYNRFYRIKNGYKNEKNWNEKNKFKVTCEKLLRYAVKFGKIKKLPCEFCGDKNSIAHHSDYSKPLKVIWLCRLHHRKIHYSSVDKSIVHTKNNFVV